MLTDVMGRQNQKIDQLQHAMMRNAPSQGFTPNSISPVHASTPYQSRNSTQGLAAWQPLTQTSNTTIPPGTTPPYPQTPKSSRPRQNWQNKNKRPQDRNQSRYSPQPESTLSTEQANRLGGTWADSTLFQSLGLYNSPTPFICFVCKTMGHRANECAVRAMLDLNCMRVGYKRIGNSEPPQYDWVYTPKYRNEKALEQQHDAENMWGNWLRDKGIDTIEKLDLYLASKGLSHVERTLRLFGSSM